MIAETSMITVRWRALHPEAVLSDMTWVAAEEIVAAWEGVRGECSVTEQTRDDYFKTFRGLRGRCAKQLGEAIPEAIEPRAMVDFLFEESRRLKKSAWKKYRSASIHAFAELLTEYRECDLRGTDFSIALAVLIVVNRPPHSDERPDQKIANTKAGIPEEDALDLFDALYESSIHRSKKARLYAMATLMTGLRPGEWKDVELTEPTETLHSDQPTKLHVATSKQKAGQSEHRTLVLMTEEARFLVRDQMDMVSRETYANDWIGIHPIDNLHKKCSSLIMEACKRLWPNDKYRWYTLYDFRHQARANFAAAFDAWIAAAMLGHGFEVGRQHYAPRRKRWSSGTMCGVGPGRDVLERAALSRLKYPARDVAERPWQRDAADMDDDIQTRGKAETP